MNKKIKGLLIAIIVIVIILIISIGVLFGLYEFTDVFKTKKQLFFKYAGKSVEYFESFEDENIKNYEKRKLEESYESNGSLSGKLGDEIENSVDTVRFGASKDIKNDYDYEEITLDYGQNVNMKINYIDDGNYLAIKMPEIMTKYIGIDVNDLDTLYDNLELTEEQKEYANQIIENYSKYIKNATLPEMITIKEDYKNVINNNINEENVSVEKNENGKKYTLALSKNQLLTIMKQLAEVIRNDENVTNYLKDNFEITDSQIEMIKETINDKIDELEDSIDDELEEDDEANFVVISLQVTKKSISSIEINIKDDANYLVECKDNEIDISLKDVIDEDSSTTNQNDDSFNIKLVKNINENNISYNLDFTTNSNDNIKLSFVAEFSSLQTDSVTESYKMEFASDDYSEYNFKYENNIEFKSINKEQLTQNEIATINNKSLEQMETILEKMITEFYRLNTEKWQQTNQDNNLVYEEQEQLES